MNNYELLFIIDADASDEAKEAAIARFTGIIENGGGKVTTLNRWGNKKLAYEIGKKSEGFYVLLCFESAPELTAEIERVMGIADNIMRFMLVKKLVA